MPEKRLESIAAPEPKWTAPTHAAPPGTAAYWFGTLPLRTNRRPYSPWPQSIQLGSVELPMWTSFIGRPTGDASIDGVWNWAPASPGEGPGVSQPGAVARLTERQVAEALEALDYTFLREGQGILQQQDFRATIERDALVALVQWHEAGRSGPPPEGATRTESKFITYHAKRSLDDLRAIVNGSIISAQITSHQPGDIPVGGAVYLLRAAEADALDDDELRRWRPAGTDFWNLKAFPSPLRRFSPADRENLAAFTALRAAKDSKDRLIDAEVVAAAAAQGIRISEIDSPFRSDWIFDFGGWPFWA